MKILLLNSPWINNHKEYGIKSGTRWAAIRKRDRSMPYFPFPDFMATTTAFLKEAGFDAHIKDAVAEELSKDECFSYVKDLAPELVVIEAFTPSIYIDLAFAKEVKVKTSSLIAFCGAHPTALAYEILQNDFIDFVLLGEYDYTLRELCRFLSGKQNDFMRIKGLGYKQAGGLIKINQRRPVIKNLDELPSPITKELPMSRYNEPVSKYYPNARVVTSRGCPYNCIFCIEPFMSERIYRKRPVDRVVEEIKILIKEYGIKEILFDDAIFTIPRAKEISEGLEKNRIKIAWSCWMDWKITLAELRLLKQRGCTAIKFGVESANSEILKKIAKPVYIENIKRLVGDCKTAGVLAHGSFMLGLPGETVKSMQETINLAFSLGLTSCQFTVATPLPGTEFYRMALKNGWLVTNDWSKFESLESPVIEYSHCTRDDIINAVGEVRRRKVKQFLKNPVNVLNYTWKLYKLKGMRVFCHEILSKAKFVLKAIFHKK